MNSRINFLQAMSELEELLFEGVWVVDTTPPMMILVRAEGISGDTLQLTLQLDEPGTIWCRTPTSLGWQQKIHKFTVHTVHTTCFSCFSSRNVGKLRCCGANSIRSHVLPPWADSLGQLLDLLWAKSLRI